jgi:hypothetical protein
MRGNAHRLARQGAIASLLRRAQRRRAATFRRQSWEAAPSPQYCLSPFVLCFARPGEGPSRGRTKEALRRSVRKFGYSCHLNPREDLRTDCISSTWERIVQFHQYQIERQTEKAYQCTLLQGQLLTSIHPRVMACHEGLLSWMQRRTARRYQLPRWYCQYIKIRF